MERQYASDLINLKTAHTLGYGSSLRQLQWLAQTGKLQAIKPGAVWLTTKVWLRDSYIKPARSAVE